jgi:diguanylate cyclase (GGDEF)-like protein
MREVLEQRRPVWLESESGAQTAGPLFATGGYPSWLGVPLVVKDRVIGLMELWSAEARAFGADESRLVAAFADEVAVALENARLFEETRRLAVTDSLTGLYNRRQFFALGEREMELALRYPSRRLSAFLLDIDHFKQVNDSYGHATGDRVLVEVARVLRQELRKIDLFARVGGEEFAGLLPESGLDGARQTAERLRVRFESLSSPSIPRFTVSLGVAEVGPDCPDLDTLLERCDQALYEAKGRGRNQVAVFGAGRAVWRGW